MTLPFKTHALLEHRQINHGFFGRKGGVSLEQYESLNAGYDSGDATEKVTENRARITHVLNAEHLLSLRQVHSREVVIIDAPFTERPKADGMVTRLSGVALSALSADCGPVLFADTDAAIIGACHAGWRGALSGITDATIETMVELGARREAISAVLGPCISQPSYEVGESFRDTFIGEREIYDSFFRLGPEKESGPRQPHFDLKAFILHRLKDAGLTRIAALPDCTYAQPNDYFSYRYNTHKDIVDYGRNISAIMLR